MRFLAPAFLWLLPLALIPVIIHLLSRLRLKRQEFPSLLLLQAVSRERFSWVRLKEIILLVIRTLVLLLIPLGLSRPFISPRYSGWFKTEQVLVIIDDSYSLGYGERWSRVIMAAQQIIRSSLKPRLMLASKSDSIFSNPGVIGALLDTLRPSALSAPLTSVLVKAESVARARNLPVFLITDLQRGALPDSNYLLMVPNLNVIFVGSPNFDNAGINRVYRYNGRLRAEVNNYGKKTVTRTVRLILDGHLSEQTVSIQPRSSAVVEFALSLNQPGIYTGKVELSFDSLLVDNVRYFVLEVLPRITVPIFTHSEGSARYLEMALSADTQFFQPVVMDINRLRSVDLGSYRLLIVAEAERLSRAEFDRLSFYLKSNGAALFCLGDADPAAGLGRYLMVTGLGQPAGFVSPVEVDTDHPILEIFQPGDFSGVRVFNYVRIAGGKSLLRLSDGQPLIVEMPDENLIVWTFLPRPEYSDIVFKAVFAPLLHRTVAYLARTQERNEYTTGDTVVIALSTSQPVVLSTPSGERTVSPVVSQHRALVRITDTRIPGIYQLANGERRAVAVNPLPDEGDLMPLSLRFLRSNGIMVQSDWTAAGRTLTVPLLYWAALLLVLEMIILSAEFYRKIPVRR